jgi:hypothetical protein
VFDQWGVKKSWPDYIHHAGISADSIAYLIHSDAEAIINSSGCFSSAFSGFFC